MKVERKEIEDMIQFMVGNGLRENEALGMVLLARKKYCDPDCPLRKGQRYLGVRLVRGPSTADREDIISAEEVARIVYKTAHEWLTTEWLIDDFVIPKKALSFSLVGDILDMKKMAEKYLSLVETKVKSNQFGSALNVNRNLSHVMMKYGPMKKFEVIDVDVPGKEGLEIAGDFASTGDTIVLRTHGGYHVLIKRPFNERIYSELIEMYRGKGVDYKGVILVALPGTPRGGKMVKIVKDL